jgi:hypothetical protein
MGMERRAREGSTKVIPNPPMPHAAVSVAIVVRAWESHVPGEGPPRERCASSNPAECKGLGILAKVSGARNAINPFMGAPWAVKAARTVATGGWEDTVRLCVLSLPTDTSGNIDSLVRSRRSFPPVGPSTGVATS